MYFRPAAATRLRFVVAVSVAITLSGAMLSPGPVAAADPDVHTPPWADSFYGNWGGVDFTPSAVDFVSIVGAHGYTAFKANVSTFTAIGDANGWDDAVWAFYGHANAGFMQMVVGADSTYLYANQASLPSGSTCGAGRAACLSGPGFAKLHDVRFMLFAGCHTANVGSTGISLQQGANNVGVDSSLAFSNYIYPNGAVWKLWNQTFFTATTANGQTVLAAGAAAEDAVWAKYHLYEGVTSAVVWGPGTKLKPAAYGS